MRVLILSLLVIMVACKTETKPSELTTFKVAEESPVQMKVYPERVALAVGEEITFGAFVAGVTEPGLVWSIREIDGGRIDNTGLYTAPSQTGTYHVEAMSRVFPAAQVTAVVEVLPKVVISPQVLFGVTDQTGIFTAAVQGADNQLVEWGAKAPLGYTNISPSGEFKAPSLPGAYEVFATSKHDRRASAQAIASISATAPWGWDVPDTSYRQLVATDDGGYAALTISGEVHRFDGIGNLLWAKSYDPSSGWGVYSFAATSQGFVLGGINWVAGTDGMGEIRWAKTIGGFSPIQSIQPGEAGTALLSVLRLGVYDKVSVLELSSDGAILSAYGVGFPEEVKGIVSTGVGVPVLKKNSSVLLSLPGINLTKVAEGSVRWSYLLGTPDQPLESGNLDILALDGERIIVSQIAGFWDGHDKSELRIISVEDKGMSAELAWAVSFSVGVNEVWACKSSGPLAIRLQQYANNIMLVAGGLIAEITYDGKVNWKRHLTAPFVENSLAGIALSSSGEPIIAGNESPLCSSGPNLDEYSGFLFKLSPGGLFPFPPERDWALKDFKELSVSSPDIALKPVEVTLTDVSHTFSMTPITDEVAVPVVRGQVKW
jgi:hypothetical protein